MLQLTEVTSKDVVQEAIVEAPITVTYLQNVCDCRLKPAITFRNSGKKP